MAGDESRNVVVSIASASSEEQRREVRTIAPGKITDT